MSNEPREFVENDEGVHLLYGDFTLCGWAWDAPFTEPDFSHGEFMPTKKRTVTCERCVSVIKYCRGLRIQEDE